MALNIPDPTRYYFELVPQRDPFSGGAQATWTEPGEGGLMEILRMGTQFSLKGEPSGSLTIEVSPRKVDGPPLYLRVMGSLYRRVD